jgi:hypothetical protein
VFTVKVAPGFEVDWLPLAHPAAPQPYQMAHEKWVNDVSNAVMPSRVNRLEAL